MKMKRRPLYIIIKTEPWSTQEGLRHIFIHDEPLLFSNKMHVTMSESTEHWFATDVMYSL
jgi:hypothetical protein